MKSLDTEPLSTESRKGNSVRRELAKCVRQKGGPLFELLIFVLHGFEPISSRGLRLRPEASPKA